MTGLEHVTAALQEIGVLGQGQTASGEDGQFALAVHRRLVNAWAADRLTISAVLRTVQALTSGTRDYTIGSGGAINIIRPQAIDRAGWIHDSTATDPIERPITVLTEQQWAAVRQKTLDAAVVEALFYDRRFDGNERGTVSTYPTVNVTNTQLVLYTLQATVGFTTVAEALTFPPAYEEALHFNLARRLCRPYGRPLTQDLIDDANRTKAVITRANHRPQTLVIPRDVPGMGPYGSDIQTGEPV